MIRAFWCSKSSLAKAAGAEVPVLADRWKMARRCGTKHIFKSKCTKHRTVGPSLEVPMSKNGTALWREAHFQVKMHKTPHGQQFLKFRCSKMARRCGAKHICKAKCTKHRMLGPILEVSIRKSCTRMWREVRLYVKMCKTPHSRATFWS